MNNISAYKAQILNYLFKEILFFWFSNRSWQKISFLIRILYAL